MDVNLIRYINLAAELENNKALLTRQEYMTIRGQITKGDFEAAGKGLYKILKRCKK